MPPAAIDSPMNDPAPIYHAPPPPDALPPRALNLARLALEIERRHGGRAQVTLVLTMIDGVWALVVARPSELERLGE